MSAPTDSPSQLLAGFLATASDAVILEILGRRADAIVPAPSSLSVLAHRLLLRASVQRALHRLDRRHLAVLEAIAFAVHRGAQPDADTAADTASAAGATPTTVAAVVEVIKEYQAGVPAPVRAATQTIAELGRTALVWSTSTAPRARLFLAPALLEFFTPDTPQFLPRAFAAIQRTAEEAWPETVAGTLRDLDSEERRLLTLLGDHSLRGQTGGPDTRAPGSPIARLEQRGVLARLNPHTVSLPRPFAQVLAYSAHPELPRLLKELGAATWLQPSVSARPVAEETLAAAAGGEALTLLRECEAVLNYLETDPRPALKSGGFGARELGRLAKHTGLSIPRAALVLELARGAELIARGDPEPRSLDPALGDLWAPTPLAAAWRRGSRAWRWAVLLVAWWWLPNAGPESLADTKTAYPVLADPDVGNRAIAERHSVIETLALVPCTSPTEAELIALLLWHRPLSGQRIAAGSLRRVLEQAQVVGAVAWGGLNPALSPLFELSGALPTHGVAPMTAALGALGALEERHPLVERLAAALPTPVDYVLLQADFTAIAPGPLTEAAEGALSAIAHMESAGAGGVYRFTEASVRGALDAGLSAAEIHRRVATLARTEVPQGLTVLIDDVARRHGQVRAGMALSYIRSEDPALLQEILRHPVAAEAGLRELAATVAVSLMHRDELLARLAESGLALVAEDAAGGLVATQPRAAVVTPHRPRSGAPAGPGGTNDWTELVAAMRAGELARSTRGDAEVRAADTHAAGVAVTGVLHRALRSRDQVRVRYVTAAGVAGERIVEPLTVAAGHLDGRDVSSNKVVRIALHRLTSVSLIPR